MFLTGNFELGVGRGVEGIRKNHPTPKDPGNHIFRSVPKIGQNLGTQLFLEKKLEHFKVSFFPLKKNEISLGNELGL